MMASSLSLKPFFSSLFTDFINQASVPGNFPTSLWIKKEFDFRDRLLFFKKFSLNCSIERDMDVSTSAVVGDLTECRKETNVKEPSVSTLLMNFESRFDPYDAVSVPLYQTATFKQPSAIENGTYDYTRSGNPTRDALESLLAKLDKADQAFCFTSGMAALTDVTHLIGNGKEIVAGDDLYGGSDCLLSPVTPKAGIVVKRVNTTDLAEVASAIGPKTKLVWIESPTNPRLQISDICKIAEMAHEHGALVLVDNSIMSPVLSRPLELGAAWRKIFISCKMLKALDWLHLIVGSVCEESRPWPYL